MGITLGFLAAVAVTLRLIGLDHSLWIDETGSLAQAAAPDFWANARHDVHPPLYFALLRLGLMFTPSFVALRLFSVVCGLTLVALAAWALRASLHAMLVAGLIVAALPEFLFHSQQLRPYALLLLLLGVALVLAVRTYRDPADHRSRIALALVLLVAATTHLVTAFFLLALVPLLAWPMMMRGPRAVGSALLPLLPAGSCLIWLKWGFVDQPGDLVEGWWMQRPTPLVVVQALGDTIGWKDIQWLADAASRHVPGGGHILLGLAIAGPLLAGVTAWGRRTEPLVAALLASVFVYVSALITYSLYFEPLVAGRTLLPALLPMAAALAVGIGAHPRTWQRTAATAAIALYVGFTVVPVVRLALTPIAGLRGLAASARENVLPGDAVVLFRSMDYGLRPYWPDFSQSDPLCFNQTQPVTPQLAVLGARLDRLGPAARVFVAYRDDYYFQRNRAAFEAVLSSLAARGRLARPFWHENDLTLLLASPGPVP